MQIIRIGRDSSNNVVVKDPLASRKHCQIIEDDNGNFRIDDLDSLNGTYVNGVLRRGSTYLSPNDIVRIGNTVLPWQNYFIGGKSPDRHPFGHSGQKQRHGFVTFWLVLCIVSSVVSLGYGIYQFVLVDDSKFYITSDTYNLSLGIMLVTIVQSILSIVFYSMILNWKKSGFWGLMVTTLVFGIVNSFLLNEFIDSLYVYGVYRSAFSVANPAVSFVISAISLVIFWAILQIKEKGISCWKQLE